MLVSWPLPLPLWLAVNIYVTLCCRCRWMMCYVCHSILDTILVYTIIPVFRNYSRPTPLVLYCPVPSSIGLPQSQSRALLSASYNQKMESHYLKSLRLSIAQDCAANHLPFRPQTPGPRCNLLEAVRRSGQPHCYSYHMQCQHCGAIIQSCVLAMVLVERQLLTNTGHDSKDRHCICSIVILRSNHVIARLT